MFGLVMAFLEWLDAPPGGQRRETALEVLFWQNFLPPSVAGGTRLVIPRTAEPSGLEPVTGAEDPEDQCQADGEEGDRHAENRHGQQAQDELDVKSELQRRNPGIVPQRDIEKLQVAVAGRQGSLDAATASIRG